MLDVWYSIDLLLRGFFTVWLFEWVWKYWSSSLKDFCVLCLKNRNKEKGFEIFLVMCIWFMFCRNKNKEKKNKTKLWFWVSLCVAEKSRENWFCILINSRVALHSVPFFPEYSTFSLYRTCEKNLKTEPKKTLELAEIEFLILRTLSLITWLIRD